MPKLFPAHKGNLIGLFFILPLFLYFTYEGIVNSNYLLGVGSIVVWLLFVLFAMNYWFQALVLFIVAFVASYYEYWSMGILLLLLSSYMVNAAKFIERGGLATMAEFREKLPMAGQIIDLLQDKKKMRVFLIILTVVGVVISFFMIQYIKAP